MRPLFEVTPQHIGKIGIALCGEYRDRVTGKPENETRDPHSKAETQCRRDRSINDRDGPRRTSQQNWLGQRPVQRNLKAFDAHEMSAPPPNEKNDRKKLDAANAID